MLRISTHLAYTTGVDTLQKRQRDMSDAQARLTSGKRVEKASDDPTAAARAERAMAAAARADANQRALDASRNNMVQAEAALGDADELMQQAREMVVSAGNASFDDSQRAAVVQRLAGLRAQLLQVANRGDGTGGYLFGQQDPVTPPFADVAGTVQATGPSALRYTASDESLPLNRDGNATWMTAPSGNGVFETRATSTGGGAFVDAGRAAQGLPITSTYDVRFNVSGGTTTYDLFKDGVPTATAQPWASGQAIDLEPGRGLAFTVSGKPVDGETFQAVPSQPTLTVFDALDKAINVLGTGQHRRPAGHPGGAVRTARPGQRVHHHERPARRCGRLAGPAGQHRKPPGRAKVAGPDRPLFGRGPGHGAGRVRLQDQAKQLRCCTADLFDGAAHVAVPVPERLTP